ncbi:MAG: DNA primase [Defluviitaleaceae bacterium]|nr:DNA primase [Defluviitaleaceae bacterium]
MRYPQEVIEEVRAGNDIVDVVGGYVTLRNKGGKFFGLCPFHNEKTPSFSVSNDMQMYYCFGCGAGGNVISFIMQLENYDFVDALKFLADRIHYTLPIHNQSPAQSQAAKQQLRTREILRDIHKISARFYHDTLQSDSSESISTRLYLDNRRIHPKIRKSFGLGLSLSNWDELLKHLQNHNFTTEDLVASGLIKPNKQGGYYDRFRGRLMFPIMDIDGHVVGFGGRVTDDKEPKYLNSPETPLFDKSRQLYGIHAARKSRNREIIMVEGYLDVLSLHQAGFPQTVGVLGTAVTPHHCRLLKRINCTSVTLLFDRDRAGTQAVLRAIPVLTNAGIKVKCLQVTEDTKDPDEFLQKYSPAHFAQLLDKAQSHVAYRINLLSKEHDIQNTDQRILFTQEVAKVLADIENAIEADAYIQETARFTGIASQAIKAEVDKQRKPHFTQEPAPRDRPTLRHNLKGNKNERGLLEARKGILSMLFAYPDLSRKMQEFLSPEEMGTGVAPKLLKMAYENGEKNIVSAPADIIAHFETLKEQQQTAEMLKDSICFDDKIALEKALNEMWKIIKRAWLNENIEKIEQKNDEIDLNAINTLGKAIRNLEKQYITITNG